jgi:hypothetical protein
MNRLNYLKKATAVCFVALGFTWLAPSGTVKAVNPSPDGGYPRGNTAEGEDPLFKLITGAANTAIGTHALYSTTDGDGNTATGFFALNFNTTGSNNTGTGNHALHSNKTGRTNTAMGFYALNYNTTGNQNTATGGGALEQNQIGNQNTAIGYGALTSNTTGGDNIAVGYAAGSKITTGSQNIDIGNVGVAGDSGTIRIGDITSTRTFIAGIRNVPVTGSPVVVDSNSHQLGVVASSKRFKQDIKPMGQKSDAILALQPVSFHYTKDIDPKGTAQFGLVAEEVAKVNPALVLPDKEGKPYTVRYDAVNAMLLNEFLKEHQKVEQMQKQIDALSAALQKVSAQLELNKPAPQTVLNDQ